jgi:hypothetical protein
MRKSLLLLLIFLLAASALNAQLWKLRRYEIYGGPGTTQFFGDIGGFSRNKNILGIKDISFQNTRFNFNLGMRYRIIENVSARVNFALGYFHSADVKGSNVSRGLESQTIFFEPALIGEYYFIKNKTENSYLIMKGKRKSSGSFFSKLDLYAFTGIGGLSYKVRPNDQLESLMTKTTGFSAIIPAGLGITMIYSGIINLGIEVGGRYSLSDLVDGYKSDSSQSNDIYYFLNFNFIYKIRTGKNGLPLF